MSYKIGDEVFVVDFYQKKTCTSKVVKIGRRYLTIQNGKRFDLSTGDNHDAERPCAQVFKTEAAFNEIQRVKKMRRAICDGIYKIDDAGIKDIFAKYFEDEK